MTKTTRRAAATVVVAVLGWTPSAAATESSAAIAGQQSRMAPDTRVRGVSARVVAVINEAAAQSKTFRSLVDQIGTTDGVVYVAEGQCRNAVRACLLHTMTAMGPHRVLWILVDARNTDRELMAYIGHELQHAVEVLSNRNVRSSAAMISDALVGFGQSCRTEAAVRSTPTHECRKSRAAIHRVDFRPRVLVVASQLKCLVPWDGCRIEKAISRRAASAYERARFPGVCSRRRMADRADRNKEGGPKGPPLRHFVRYLDATEGGL